MTKYTVQPVGSGAKWIQKLLILDPTQNLIPMINLSLGDGEFNQKAKMTTNQTK